MNYKQFQEELQQKVSENLGSTSNVTLEESMGNNDVMRSGLKLDSPQKDVQSMIYLDSCYQAFTDGMEISQIADNIVQLQKHSPLKIKPQYPKMLDFDRVKSKIIFKLVNAKANVKQLADMPYIPFLDLAIVFCIVLEATPSGIATIPIHKDLFTSWNIDISTLYACASKNGPHIFPPKLTPLADIVKEFRPSEVEDNDIDPLLVLTNPENQWGPLLYFIVESCKK